MAVAALALGVLALCALAPRADGAARLEPPDGQVISGVAPEYGPEKVAEFAKLTGQPKVAVYHRFVGELEPFSDVVKDLKKVDAAGMITWRMMAGSSSAAGGNHASIARGDIDAYLVQQAAAAAGFGRPLFLRPNWEMNGDWFDWSTYTEGGSQRPGNSPALYRQSWQRARIIFEGGSRATIDSRLAAVGLPALRASGSGFASATNVAWVWSPTKGPVKQADKPHRTLDYYPGDAYVDWVGVSLHQWGDTTLSHWTSSIDAKGDPVGRLDDLYREMSVRRGKPFILSEWAVSGPPLGNGDNPQYIRDVFAWVAARPKVKAQIYFNRTAGSISHSLDQNPKARAAFAEQVARIHSIHDWRQIATGAPAPLPAAGAPPAGSGPAGSAPAKPGSAPARSCATGLTGVLAATGARARARTFRAGRTTVRLRATRRWVRGTVVVAGTRKGRVTVAVRGSRAKAVRKGARRWIFGRGLPRRAARHDVVVVVRRPGAAAQRVRVRVATTRRAVRTAAPKVSCATSRADAVLAATGSRPRARTYRVGRTLLRLRAGDRAVRGVVVSRDPAARGIAVAVGGDRRRAVRRGDRRWAFGARLARGASRHDVVVVVARRGAPNQRLRVRVATHRDAVLTALSQRR